VANPEHLKILKQGVETWNKWWKENPFVHIDLSRADLSGADLRRVILRGANLTESILVKARLFQAILRGSNLTGAKLTQADLRKADLRDASLGSTILIFTDLGESDLSSADMVGANLMFANLRKADMKNADLRHCILTKSKLDHAMLTGVKLYGTARDDWIIEGVECKYVYWDWEGKQRSPKDRDLEPGEFERLYAALPTIEYIFEHGMTSIDPLIMDRVVQVIREKRPEFDIRIDSINARGLAPSIKFTVQQEDHKEPALSEVTKEYQIKQAQLEGKLEEISKHIKNLIDRPNTINIINAPQAKYLAIDGSTLNVQETSNYYAFELRKAVVEEPAESKTFAKVAKNKALDMIGKAFEDIAKGQVKEAAKQIIQLGKDLGPIIVNTAAYAFFRSLM
jgi:hypothetical protein